MLFETLSSDDPSMYVEQVRFDLVGPLDLDRFRAAWETVHARHAMLRTVFLWDGLDEPLQAVLGEIELDWNPPDPAAEAITITPREVADARALHRRIEGVDLGRSPISTFDLIAIDADRIHVIWSFHHLLLDGWSTARVVGEVLDRYADASDEPASSEFRPYLEWLADRDPTVTDGFWRGLLANVSEPTILGRTGADPFVRGRLDVTLSNDDSALIRAAAASHRVTINTMVQGAWARTLARYTGRTDVVFGVTVSGRPHDLDGADDAVGMFLNTLPFPATVPHATERAEWLQALQRQQLAVGEHGHASLAEVQRLAPAPAGALFDTILVFENYPRRAAAPNADIAVEDYDVFEQSHYALTIMAGDLPDTGELGFIVVHDESAVSPTFARQVVDDLVAELLELAGQPIGAGRPSDALVHGDAAIATSISSTLAEAT